MTRNSSLFGAMLAGLSWLACASAAHAQYTATNLIANDPSYNPQIVDPNFGDSWGIAIRPAGAGGHFWITNKDTGVSSEYVGDVNGVPLHQDSLTTVTIPSPSGSPDAAVSQPTGVVFNQTSDFRITQTSATGSFDAPATFLFATNDGTIAAWSDQNTLPNGSPNRPSQAVLAVDNSAAGDNYFGLATTNLASGNYLYAANFGTNPGIETYNSTFQNVSSQFAFTNPFAAQGYEPFNIENLGGSLFVAYAQYGSAGTEVHGTGLGKLAEYDSSGNLITTWDDKGLLNSPWGMAIAPSSFGKYSGDLLIGNFGDIDQQAGSIVAFDPLTHAAVGYLDDASGKPLVEPGVWGLTFGNGASLGAANALYFAAGPNDENDGVFGRITVAAVPEASPAVSFGLLLALGLSGLAIAARKRKMF